MCTAGLDSRCGLLKAMAVCCQGEADSAVFFQLGKLVAHALTCSFIWFTTAAWLCQPRFEPVKD